MLAKVEGNKSKAKQPFEERIHELTDLKNQVITMLNGLEQVLQSDHSGKEKLNIIQDKVAYFQDQFLHLIDIFLEKEVPLKLFE